MSAGCRNKRKAEAQWAYRYNGEQFAETPAQQNIRKGYRNMKKLLVLVVSILAAAVSAAQEPVFILKNDVCVGRIQKTFFQKGEKFI